MRRTDRQLHDDALAIWQAGVDAVDSRQLVIDNVHVAGGELVLGETRVPLDRVRRIAVVGAGKAGAGMSEGLEAALGSALLADKQLDGWVNVPADCVRPLERIRLHAARPAGVNEPTAEGVRGARQILRLVAELTPDDLCICLLSGGGSALLPAPVPEITLADKQAVTKVLSGAGANIAELNTVRKQLSQIKGGGLARACRAGRLVTLIISDVMGDPLDVIASGPTVPDTRGPADALAVLDKFAAARPQLPTSVFAYLDERAAAGQPPPGPAACRVTNLVIGNNAVAVDAAGVEAERRGYAHAMTSADRLEGRAEDVGRHLAEMAMRMRAQRGPDCLISGGEPVVELAAEAERGKGGRNQQLVLAALARLLELERQAGAGEPLAGLALLAGGTDGEDGPTDAAGAWIDARVAAAARRQGLQLDVFLRRNDAYHFFEAVGALIKTGPTHTNVCDLRVVTVSRARAAG